MKETDKQADPVSHAPRPARWRRWLAGSLRVTGLLAACALLAALYINHDMVASCPFITDDSPLTAEQALVRSGTAAAATAAPFVEGAIYESPELTPAARVAIVPGAAVYENGRPSQILRERLDTALALYQAGKVRKILVSGNNQLKHNRESEIMRLWLIRQGVNQTDVQCDHAGFRTLDTCARAARVWNLQNEPVIFVSQRFHLPRTLYLARAWGLHAVGASANLDGMSTHFNDHWRELVARLKAWLDIRLLDTQPKYYGPAERI